ncbi:MAG: hypothetical protein HY521_05775 [Proteobacteria bacterium]|nr:hypothetical protein [Pseudomonadota bacterium]
MRRARRRRIAGWLALAGAALAATTVLPGPAGGQTLGLSTLAEGAPLEVVADEGIEWQQGNKLFIARGNARATRGEVTVHADELIAAYREGEGKKGARASDVYRLEAVGKVRIVSPKERAYGDHAVYDVDQEVFVLTGRSLRLVTEQDEVRARDSLEYWAAKSLAVARGQALTIREGRRLEADVLTARFASGQAGAGRIERVEAFGDVLIRTPTEVVRAERGAYDVESGIATLAGSVKITRGRNQLNGSFAEVNLKTGVSRLLARPGTGGRADRVFGLIQPDSRGQTEKETAR